MRSSRCSVRVTPAAVVILLGHDDGVHAAVEVVDDAFYDGERTPAHRTLRVVEDDACIVGRRGPEVHQPLAYVYLWHGFADDDVLGSQCRCRKYQQQCREYLFAHAVYLFSRSEFSNFHTKKQTFVDNPRPTLARLRGGGLQDVSRTVLGPVRAAAGTLSRNGPKCIKKTFGSSKSN